MSGAKSIIPVFAKLSERLMYNRIISFLFENKILSEAQNGFRKGKSIDTAVQPFIGRIQKALDKRVHTTGIFIDLTKASSLVFSLEGRAWQEPEPSHVTGMALVHCILGVVCHCFPRL